MTIREALKWVLDLEFSQVIYGLFVVGAVWLGLIALVLALLWTAQRSERFVRWANRLEDEHPRIVWAVLLLLAFIAVVIGSPLTSL